MEFPPPTVHATVAEIARLLRKNGHTLAVSEAACGGLLSACLISVPGASDFYIGGKLVYSARHRLRLSGWSDSDISSYVGPLEQVALKLARTTKYEWGLTFVLSETGFAGPTTDLHLENGLENAVGTVFLGLSTPRGEVSCRRETGCLERSQNMVEFARLGLEFLLETLREQE